MTPLDLSIICGTLLVAGSLVILATRTRVVRGKDLSAPPDPFVALREDFRKQAEMLGRHESRMKQLEQEWEETYAKLRKAQGRAYRDKQVADGKHKGAKSNEEEVPEPILSPTEQRKAIMRGFGGRG